MEYMILGMALLAFFVFYVIRCIMDDRKKRAAFVKSLYTDYGKASAKKYPEGRLDTIAGHYRKNDQAYSVDEITWNDLNMDRVFQKVDYTYSAAGEEALYTMFRCPCLSEQPLLERERLVRYFMEHEEDRVKLQLFFARLGRTGKYSIYDYIMYMDTLGERGNAKHFAVIAGMLAAIVLSMVSLPVGLPVLFVLICYNMLTYAKEKSEIDPYITTFGYFLRVLKVVKELGSYRIEAILGLSEELTKRAGNFGKFSRFSFLLMHQNDLTSGNPFEVVLDYLRMVLHLNLIKFNTMLSQAQAHKEDILYMVETLGYIEATISIGCFRASLPYYTTAQFTAVPAGRADTENGRLLAQELYHPLIENPVTNSVNLRRGMLLTGSNASGKSTFLKTVAIAQILAQTIYTVPARSYCSSFYRVYTSMALRDDLEAKESYFIVEIKAMKRILDAIADGETPVMCFVDEVLRGTNTVERIAASTQILKSLSQAETFPFAATHDIELTGLLQQDYENYHFEETVEENDVRFNYCLQHGKASSRNAIRLLGVMGYDETMIQRAEQMAQDFLDRGEWKS